MVFNGYYIGRHNGGYDPFSFDLTDFALPGVPNVLLVRVDAILSDGWFYEGPAFTGTSGRSRPLQST